MNVYLTKSFGFELTNHKHTLIMGVDDWFVRSEIVKMHSFMRYLFIITLIITLVLGCAKTNYEDSEVVMALIPRVIGSTYFDLCAEGAKEAAVELGVEVIYKGPTTADAASQVNIIQDMIFKKVDILAISPIDSAAVEPMLQQAREAGILVITYDADVAVDSRDIFVSQVSEEVLGRYLMDKIAVGLNGEGQFAILTAFLTASNQNTWMSWMEEQRKEKYKDMELVTVIPTDEDQQLAYLQAQNLMYAYPELEAIVALSTIAVPGAARAIEFLNYEEKIELYGLGLPNDMKEYLMTGAADSVTLWNPIDLGNLTVRIAKDLYDGNEIEDAAYYGEIGPIRYIHEDEIVIMGEPLDFTKENVHNYDF